ncbi:MAG: hypothetical protein ACYC1P_12955 [Gaiellaceae bacterium]
MHVRDAAELVDQLELDVMAAGICLPCLTFVAFPLDLGDERDARREARRIAPDLWAEGLELTVLVALETAKRDGVDGAVEAIDDVQARGPRSPVVQAIVFRLAEQLVEDMHRHPLPRENGMLM